MMPHNSHNYVKDRGSRAVSQIMTFWIIVAQTKSANLKRPDWSVYTDLKENSFSGVLLQLY